MKIGAKRKNPGSDSVQGGRRTSVASGAIGHINIKRDASHPCESSRNRSSKSGDWHPCRSGQTSFSREADTSEGFNCYVVIESVVRNGSCEGMRLNSIINFIQDRDHDAYQSASGRNIEAC